MANLLDTCYLNGEFQDIASAKIPVLDRGFIFGDAVYEVIPVFDGITLALDLHLRRLKQSLAAINISTPMTDPTWTELIYELIERNGGGDQGIYLQVSRGAALRDHAIPQDIEPTILVFAHRNGPANESPVAAVTGPDIRWQRCDIKSTSLLANVMLRTQAHERGAFETILFRDGVLTEGAASNVFLVHAERVYTPLQDQRILAGITRRLLIDALSDTDLAVTEQEITIEMFTDASELWVTSSSRDLVPIVKCDGRPVGSGDVGPKFSEIRGHFLRLKSHLLETERAHRLRQAG
ncbi:MAG: aminotransferase class IV [Gammaproteobacteria bacterium]